MPLLDARKWLEIKHCTEMMMMICESVDDGILYSCAISKSSDSRNDYRLEID